jgi:hypothetical protein
MTTEIDPVDLGAAPARHPNSAFRIYDGEAIIVLPERGENHLLNRIGTHIWDRLDGKRSLREILASIVEEFDVPADRARADLLEFIAALKGKGMVI